MRAASEPGAIGRSVDKDGNIKCPECNDTYDLHTVANCGGPKHVFDELFSLRANALTARAVEEELHEQEKRLKEEFERIQKIQVVVVVLVVVVVVSSSSSSSGSSGRSTIHCLFRFNSDRFKCLKYFIIISVRTRTWISALQNRYV